VLSRCSAALSAVRLDESRIIVQSNAVVTAGAALSHLTWH